MSNEFINSLQQFGMEGMHSDMIVHEEYEGSEVAEELIEIDNLEAYEASMESMNDAIMENGLANQTLALEAAGFSLESASGFTGELSNESVGNMIKRGYYEVKIQLKKGLQKIWKLILGIVDHVMGSEGRLKSYGKLFKKYNDRLSKINPKDKKDGESRMVTIRNWEENGVVHQLELFRAAAGGGDWIREATRIVRATNPAECIDSIRGAVRSMIAGMLRLGRQAGASRETLTAARDTMNRLTGQGARLAKEFFEDLERTVEEELKDLNAKEMIADIIEGIKEVDSDEVEILTAKAQLMNIGRNLEDQCRRDVKFKANLIKLKKAWDKKTGEFDLKNMSEGDAKDAAAACLRTLNKLGVCITGVRMGLSKIYSAIASNLQGVLADMAKVIAKGTSITN